MTPLFVEGYRLHLLSALESELRSAGWRFVCGVDEAGRGALAGPVVAAAVLLGPEPPLVPGVNDSKLLSAPQREALEPLVRRAALACAVVAVPAREIDRSNILVATRRAMTDAVRRLEPRPDVALIDAVRLSDLPCPSVALVRGDRVSYAVAAASIVAKVARDRMMVALGRRFPQYGFAAHKGYGAAAHREALARFGPCSEHRMTFRSVLPRTQGAA